MLDVPRHGNFGPLNTLPKPATDKKPRLQVAEDNLTLESELVVRILSTSLTSVSVFETHDFPKFVVKFPNLRYTDILTCWEDTLCASGKKPTQLDFESETLSPAILGRYRLVGFNACSQQHPVAAGSQHLYHRLDGELGMRKTWCLICHLHFASFANCYQSLKQEIQETQVIAVMRILNF